MHGFTLDRASRRHRHHRHLVFSGAGVARLRPALRRGTRRSLIGPLHLHGRRELRCRRREGERADSATNPTNAICNLGASYGTWMVPPTGWYRTNTRGQAATTSCTSRAPTTASLCTAVSTLTGASAPAASRRKWPVPLVEKATGCTMQSSERVLGIKVIFRTLY